MKRINRRLNCLSPIVVVGLFVFSLFWLQTIPRVEAQQHSPQSNPTLPLKRAGEAGLVETYGKLPLSFEANQGQAGSQVRFLSRGPGYDLFLTSTEAILDGSHRQSQQDGPSGGTLREGSGFETMRDPIARMALVGANPRPELHALDPLPGKSNYLIGADPDQWRTDIPHFARVEYRDVYPGVSLIYYGNQGRLEYDFRLAPGANPRKIKIEFRGARRLNLDEQGNLRIQVGNEAIEMRRPVAYQLKGSQRAEVTAQYVLNGRDQVRFELGGYNPALPLIIDPVLVYSTHLGGNNFDFPLGIAVDSSGSYLTGQTNSFGVNGDAFVMKLNPAGTGLVYATYLGGSGLDRARKVVVDAAGNAYVAGHTASPDFPTTPGAWQTTFGGRQDGFILKLNAAGSSLLYSTYLGGSQLDQCLDLAIDSQGNAYVTGQTYSANFPTTAGVMKPVSSSDLPDSFVTKLNPTGSGLVYSTYLGGTGMELGEGIAVDNVGSAYVTGRTSSLDFPTASAFQPSFAGGSAGQLGFGFAGLDAFVTKINADGTAFVYSTYLGGSGDDAGWQIVADSSGNAYVTGATSSTNFPLSVNAYQKAFGGGTTGDPLDAFVCKLDAGGSLLYSTYLGGQGDENPYYAGLAVDAAGCAYVTGGTSSINFPMMNPWQPTFGGSSDGFVTKLSPDGSALVYSSYLGGSDGDSVNRVAVDSNGNAFLVGQTSSSNFPTVNSLQPSGTIFMAIISAENSPTGSGVPVVPIDPATQTTPVTLTFSDILTSGNTTLALNPSGPVPPAGFLLGTPATYYELATTATFAGSTTVCIDYTGLSFANQSNLKLYHYEGGQWVDATVSLDTVHHEICASVTSLSPFIVAENGFQALLTWVDHLSLPKIQKIILADTLLVAQQLASRGRSQLVIGLLKAFIDETKALNRSGRLNSTIATFLIQQAQALSGTFSPVLRQN